MRRSFLWFLYDDRATCLCSLCFAQVALGNYGGKPAIVDDNQLDRQFNPDAPDQSWVTDITYIKTYEGWGYLCVVIDLFSRRVVGWSFGSRMTIDLALQALLMAVWRRKPKERVLVHSDQGSQYTSLEWKQFLASHNLEPSMSRRGNCHDNAVAESFFQLFKRERGRKFALTKAQVRMAQAAMANRDTSVAELCNELGVRPPTLYRYVDPDGNLRESSKQVIIA